MKGTICPASLPTSRIPPACSSPWSNTIGGHWPEKARTALQEIFQEQHDREPSLIHLLSDIRDAFAHHGNPKRIFTAELVSILTSRYQDLEFFQFRF